MGENRYAVCAGVLLKDNARGLAGGVNLGQMQTLSAIVPLLFFVNINRRCFRLRRRFSA